MIERDVSEVSTYPLLSAISSPADVKRLDEAGCVALAKECRAFIVEAVHRTGGHLGSNLGAVEVTIALHRVFNSPADVLLFDTGHQAYVHKLLTGRAEGFAGLRQAGGLSGYPNRAESPHDWIENSHASTALCYAYGIATAFARQGEDDPARRRPRRRRGPHRRDGLRGAEQPRPRRGPGARRAERQRPQLRPDGLQALRVAHPAPAEPLVWGAEVQGCPRPERAARCRAARGPVDAQRRRGAP